MTANWNRLVRACMKRHLLSRPEAEVRVRTLLRERLLMIEDGRDDRAAWTAFYGPMARTRAVRDAWAQP